jgi:tetratricopeptide (TPR) repeat protein
VKGFRYEVLRVLVADDFSNFRSTVNRMLLDLGVEFVDTAGNAEEVIERCENDNYDIILCDYNLGSGRNGQHVLEELRFRNLLPIRSVFVLVSAESARNIVMAAYDAAPDDYLMKPITAKMLETRLDKLLAQRLALEKVYKAIERDDKHSAMDLLIDMSIAEDRYSTAAQKMLGELFLDLEEYRKAEKLYRSVLEVRELDWARLGLARAKHLQRDYPQAEKWLEKIIEDNYLYLPAYDVLSETCMARGDAQKAQAIVKQAVDVSPMSILRQKRLSEIARKNDDIETALDAQKRVVKLGKLSCHGDYKDHLDLARTVASALEKDLPVAAGVYHEALSALDAMDEEMDLDHLARAHLCYLSARLQFSKGKTERAEELIVQGEKTLLTEDSNIEVEIDHIRALLALGYQEKVDDLLERLQQIYEHDEDALQLLDEFLDEPASDANKTMVAEVNRQGIELYRTGEYDDALSCFDKAVALFPKHVGLQLNIVQALIGKLKANGCAESEYSQALANCRTALELISSMVDQDDPQYKRFVQLKNMARAI